MTRADKIRSMSDEELAAVVQRCWIYDDQFCHSDCESDDPGIEQCLACVMRWLEEEV